jgi:shikimate kinase
VKRVLITGMSGTGKSSVIAALAARGYRAVDADEDGLSEVVPIPADEPTGLDPGQDWVWREERIRALLAEEDADLLFLGGCSPNQGMFYPQLDHVILLSAPAPVIVERLTTRTNNPYGRRPEEVARTLALLETVEPLLRRGATHEIVTTIPVEEGVARVLRIVDEDA